MNGPEDRCPYPRPFPAEFKACPAFLPRLHFATDTRGQRLKPSWTCAHLDTAQRENGGYYGQCLVGIQEQRERWANAMAAGQLGAVRDARVADLHPLLADDHHVAKAEHEVLDAIPEPERITSLDVLRGLAVLGILVMNIQSFSMIEAAYSNPTAYGNLESANYLVWLLSHVLADQKFMTIFAMLFGAGIVLMTGRREKADLRRTGDD